MHQAQTRYYSTTLHSELNVTLSSDDFIKRKTVKHEENLKVYVCTQEISVLLNVQLAFCSQHRYDYFVLL